MTRMVEERKDLVRSWFLVHKMIEKESILVGRVGVIHVVDIFKGNKFVARYSEESEFERIHIIKDGDEYYAIGVFETRAVKKGLVTEHEVVFAILYHDKDPQRLIRRCKKKIKDDVDLAVRMKDARTRGLKRRVMYANENAFFSTWNRVKFTKRGRTWREAYTVFSHTFV